MRSCVLDYLTWSRELLGRERRRTVVLMGLAEVVGFRERVDEVAPNL
jgi:hypothetical protein